MISMTFVTEYRLGYQMLQLSGNVFRYKVSIKVDIF